MKELKITKEKVLKASETCSDAKVVLRELFPEVFKVEKLPEKFKEEVEPFLEKLERLVYEVAEDNDAMEARTEWIVGKFLQCNVPAFILEEIRDILVEKHDI